MRFRSWIGAAVKCNNQSVLVALTLFLLALSQDLYFFWIGKGWTPFQYESLALLLIVGQIRFVKTSGVAIFLFLTITKVLFFQFGLDFVSMQESMLGLMLLTGLLFVAAVARLHQWRQLLLGLSVFLVAFGLITLVDKKLTNDMVASSYLNGILSSRLKEGSHSGNEIYKDLMASAMHKKGSILVVWESLGVPVDKQMLAGFEKDIAPAKMQVLSHEGGSTVTAEARYVCGVNGRVPTTPNCVPQHINGTAMHGNTLSYFSRTQLYRHMGFQTALGRSDMPSLEICHYAYTAICDEALLDLLLETVKKDKCQGFSYAMTIDSHFPYLKYSDHPVELLADVKMFLKKFEALKTELPDCELIVAGDHPPPLSKGFEAKSVLVIRR